MALDGDCADGGVFDVKRPPRQQSQLAGGPDTDLRPTTVQLLLQSGALRQYIFSNSCVTYISGCVCRKRMYSQVIKCSECVGALSSPADPPPQEAMGLINEVQRRPLGPVSDDLRHSFAC